MTPDPQLQTLLAQMQANTAQELGFIQSEVQFLRHFADLLDHHHSLESVASAIASGGASQVKTFITRAKVASSLFSCIAVNAQLELVTNQFPHPPTKE